MSHVKERPRAPDEDQPWAEVIAVLANQPVGTSWVERRRARALGLAERLTTHGPLAGPAEVGWRVSRRLNAVGSGALAALIAYRMFVWLLALALALVLALGLYSDATDTRAVDTVRRFGVAGYFATSVAQTASRSDGSGRWLALLLALVLLLYQSYALLRATAAVHSLAWGLRVRSVSRPLPTTLAVVGIVCASLLAGALLRTVPGRLGPLLGALAVLASYSVPALMWLLVSARLPNRARRWQELVPGAVVVGVAFALLHAFNAFLLLPWLESKQETYGVLGVAAGILFSLYMVGWAIAGAAALNRVLTEQRP